MVYIRTHPIWVYIYILTKR